MRVISVDIDRYINHLTNFYDSDWNFLDCKLRYDNRKDIEKPKMLKKMISLSEVLAQDFRYVRVDFYSVGSEVYFGELTFNPSSGFMQFIPQEWDRKFGDELKLY